MSYQQVTILLPERVYQQVENHLLQPLVQRRTLRMNPLLITLALLAGTGLAGVLGTLLALPVAGAIQVLLQDALQRRPTSRLPPRQPPRRLSLHADHPGGHP